MQARQGPGFWSDVGTVATYTGAGALGGALIGLAGVSNANCTNEDCLFVLGLGLVLAPVGAVIGAGVGIVEVIREHRDAARAAAVAAGASEPAPCPDARTRDSLRQCEATHGSIPIADGGLNPKFLEWFSACDASLEVKFEIRKRSELPAECLAEPVPEWRALDCKLKSALMDQDRRVERTLLQTERRRREGDPALAHCPTA